MLWMLFMTSELPIVVFRLDSSQESRLNTSVYPIIIPWSQTQPQISKMNWPSSGKLVVVSDQTIHIGEFYYTGHCALTQCPV